MESISEWLRTIGRYIGQGLDPLWQSLRSVFIWPITWKVALGYLTVGFAGIGLGLAILITFVAGGFLVTFPPNLNCAWCATVPHPKSIPAMRC
jgi:hypothetical protein